MMNIKIMSFGYKYGTPAEVNLVFDVRFLPNPYYDENLRPFCGADKPIREFMESHDETIRFCENVTSFVKFYINEMKNANRDVSVAFGCTGGKHRSVYMAEYLHMILTKNGFENEVLHRDLNGGEK